MLDQVPEILAGVGLEKAYSQRGGVIAGRRRGVRAVVNVTVRLRAGERVGLVGGSGAGKSTAVRLLAGLETAEQGSVLFGGRDISTLSASDRKGFRRAVQVVFQDPGASLDPRQRIGGAVAEPLAVHGAARGTDARRRVAGLFEAVGLPSDPRFVARLPHELSGGERQRVVIARALACEPRVLLLDEPVASLDVSVRGQVLNLLLDLQARLGLTILLVAHDIPVVKASCGRMAVMFRGRIVEEGRTRDLSHSPAHPYTQALLSVGVGGPTMNRRLEATAVDRVRSNGEGGCPYRELCSRADDRCRTEPALEPVADDSARRVACWNSLLP